MTFSFNICCKDRVRNIGSIDGLCVVLCTHSDPALAFAMLISYPYAYTDGGLAELFKKTFIKTIKLGMMHTKYDYWI